MSNDHRPGVPITSRRGALAAAACLAALAVPGFARAQEPSAEEKKAVEDVQKAGGRIDRDDKAPDKAVVAVNYSVTEAADPALDPLKSLTKVKKLSLNGTKITDAGLEKLKGLAALEKLYLVDTKITDAGLEHLKGLGNLKVLSLVGTGVTDAGMEKIKGLANLQEVFVQGTKVTDAGVKMLTDANPKVKVAK